MNPSFKQFAWTIAFITSFSAGACEVEKITVENPYILVGPIGQVNTAGYAKIKNSGDTACELVGAQAEISDRLELHTIIYAEGHADHAKGMMKMQPVKSFMIPAKGELLLTQGGNHLMFLKLKHPLALDKNIPVTLTFQDGAHKTVNFKTQKM